jgi:hypothetical protein
VNSKGNIMRRVEIGMRMGQKVDGNGKEKKERESRRIQREENGQ